MRGKLFIGTSGYNYLHWWDGVFYPKEVPQRKWLEYYCQFFKTVELNVTFYRLLQKNIFEGWYQRTPDDFIFAVKGSRFITHVKKLKDCLEPLNFFFANASALKEKLGIVLWQMPPSLKLDLERLEAFCALLKNHEVKTRHTFEFRNESWFSSLVYQLLKSYNFSLCIAHSQAWPYEKIVTADYVYLRFHGGEVLYGSNYAEEELSQWAELADGWLSEGKDVYAYFNNDAYGYAVKNSLRLREMIVPLKSNI